MYSKAKQDSVETPPFLWAWVKKHFGSTVYDPTPMNPMFDAAVHKDGLTTEWGRVTYCNPPYSRAQKFVQKGYQEYLLGKTVVLLVKVGVLGSQYFSKCPGAEVILFPSKIVFPGYLTPPRFHVCLLVYRAGQRSDKYSFFSGRQ